MVSWRPLNRKFKWLLAYLLAVKWSLAFHKRFAWLVADVKLECLIRIGNAKFLALNSGGAKLMRNFSHWDLVVRSWCEIFRIGFAWRIGGAKIFVLSSHGVRMENWWCETDAKFFALSSHWGLAVQSWCEIFLIGFALSSGDANFLHWEWPMQNALFSSAFDFPHSEHKKFNLSHNKIKLKLEIIT